MTTQNLELALPISSKVTWQQYYQGQWQDRWPLLLQSLQQDGRKVARPNRFAGASVRPDGDRSEPKRLPSGLLDVYWMDPASIVAARALRAKAGDRVLDLCAAPGGKTLVVGEPLFLCGDALGFDISSELIANEISDPRRTRLRNTLSDYFPPLVLERTRVTGHDGSKWGLYEKEAYDRIVLDAPCSGERHQLKNNFAEWTPKTSRHLAIRQYALLASAWMALKPGGRIVYSTCSISKEENDGVVAKLLKRKGDEVDVIRGEVADHEGVVLEETEFGYSILPDRSDGAGPIFFSVLEKQAAKG